MMAEGAERWQKTPNKSIFCANVNVKSLHLLSCSKSYAQGQLPHVSQVGVRFFASSLSFLLSLSNQFEMNIWHPHWIRWFFRIFQREIRYIQHAVIIPESPQSNSNISIAAHHFSLSFSFAPCDLVEALHFTYGLCYLRPFFPNILHESMQIGRAIKQTLWLSCYDTMLSIICKNAMN